MDQPGAIGTRRDGMLAGAAFALTIAGVALGGHPVAVALTAAVVPILGFLVAGHVPGRGAAVGCLALALGSATLTRAPGVVPWGELALLGLVVASATAGAAMAERMAPRPAASAAEGQWMTVVVALDGPTDVAGATVRRPVAPIRGPERRRRERLVRRDRLTVGA